jgi:hypothetical protein
MEECGGRFVGSDKGLYMLAFCKRNGPNRPIQVLYASFSKALILTRFSLALSLVALIAWIVFGGWLG